METANTLSLIAIFISIVSFLTALLLGRHSKPTVIPIGSGMVKPGAMLLAFNYKIASSFLIYPLRIHAQGFSSDKKILPKVRYYQYYSYAFGNESPFYFKISVPKLKPGEIIYLKTLLQGQYKNRLGFRQKFECGIVTKINYHDNPDDAQNPLLECSNTHERMIY